MVCEALGVGQELYPIPRDRDPRCASMKQALAERFLYPLVLHGHRHCIFAVALRVPEWAARKNVAMSLRSSGTYISIQLISESKNYQFYCIHASR
ncbi:hypothetical protein D3Y55_24345 [Mesorhizobium sp. DCY119]|nr:hypothetical protein D3Y55_24345 [Mesorhizobium sp. DCY119]